MPFSKKIETLEQTTGKLEQTVNSLSSDLTEFKSETKTLTDQVKILSSSVDHLAYVIEFQIKNLNESLQTLGKNLTQNMVENILNLPKMFTKKRDSNTGHSK